MWESRLRSLLCGVSRWTHEENMVYIQNGKKSWHLRESVRGDKSDSEPQVSISSFSMQSLDYGRKDIKGEDYFGKRKGTSGKGAGRMGHGMCVNVYMKMWWSTHYSLQLLYTNVDGKVNSILKQGRCNGHWIVVSRNSRWKHFHWKRSQLKACLHLM